MLEEPDDATKAAYIRRWRWLLKDFLGWPDHRIEQWIASKSELLRNPLLAHEHPAWYVADLLIPEALGQRLGRDRIIVENEIAFIMQSLWTAQPPYDDVRARIRAVLAEYEGPEGGAGAR